MPDTSFDYVNIFAGSYESDGKKMNTLLSEEVSQQDSGSGDVIEAKEKPATGGAVQAGTGKKVYLTFDDGPSKETEKILDILKKRQVKATFFPLAETMLFQKRCISAL